MARVLYGEINLKRAQNPYKGKRGGEYIKAIIVIKDEPDEFGNIASLRQATEVGEEKIFLGNFHTITKDHHNSDTEHETVCSKIDKLTEN